MEVIIIDSASVCFLWFSFWAFFYPKELSDSLTFRYYYLGLGEVSVSVLSWLYFVWPISVLLYYIFNGVQ